MKTTKKLLSVILAGVMLLAMAIPSFAVGRDNWETLWSSDDAAGIIMFVGSNESERNFSWYSETESEPFITISTKKNLSSYEVFKGYCVKALKADSLTK